MKKLQKTIAMAVMFALLLSTFVLPASAATGAAQFSDVSDSAWYYEYVDRLTSLGAIEGRTDGKFYPSDTITVAEFVKIIVATTIGAQEQGSDHWAENYMAMAEERNIVDDGEYAVSAWNTAITRQQMAKVVTNTLQNVLGEAAVSDTSEYTARITDWSTTAAAYKDYIAQAYAKGIIAGMDDGSFQGTKTATRAEATTMIVRLIDSTYRVSYVGDISFSEITDVTEDGTMDIDKAEDFMLELLDNMKFYKSNGSYYVDISYPELPDGYEFYLNIDCYCNSSSGFLLTTHPVISNDTREIVNTGNVTRQLTGISSVSDINMLNIYISVINEGSTSYASDGYLTLAAYNGDDEVVIVYNDQKSTRYIDFDLTQLFQW